jgi:hypothetical protein
MIAVDLTSKRTEVDEVLKLAKERPDLTDASEPSNLDASHALNVGIPGISPTEVLSFLTLVFTTGKAALEFLKLLREQLNLNNARIAVAESTTGKALGHLEATSPDDFLRKIAGE